MVKLANFTKNCMPGGKACPAVQFYVEIGFYIIPMCLQQIHMKFCIFCVLNLVW